MKRPIDISCDVYKRSHGRAPRGRGAWGFIIIDESSKNQEVDTVFVPGQMTLSDAPVWVKAYVREHYAAELATGWLALQAAP